MEKVTKDPIRIAPSILSADLINLNEIDKIIPSADLIHCDVMDGHFVPNITFGPKLIKDLRRVTDKPLDVHLMIKNPEKFLDKFIDAGADYIVIHAESTEKINFCLDRIREAKVKCGLAISPDTDVSCFEPYIIKCDLALLMSVYPGFSGQKFIGASVERLKTLKALRDKLNPACLIEMDGGIGQENIALLYKEGVDIAVAGNSVFVATCPDKAIIALKNFC